MNAPRARKSRSLRLISLFALILFFGGGMFTHFIPAETLIRAIESMPVVCPLRRITGFLCSFCGMTHAWVYFWQGDWAKAVEVNKLSLPLFVGTPFFILSLLLTHFWTEKRARFGVIASICILVGYTILRNLPI